MLLLVSGGGAREWTDVLLCLRSGPVEYMFSNADTSVLESEGAAVSFVRRQSSWSGVLLVRWGTSESRLLTLQCPSQHILCAPESL